MLNILSFFCLVFQPVSKQCSSPLSIEASTRTKYLSSIVTGQTSCGLHQSPYVLEAKEGQQIELILHDFNINTEYPTKNCVNNYGYILDNKNDDVINLCGGIVRTRKIHTSAGNIVQILLDKNKIPNNHFLLEFKGMLM